MLFFCGALEAGGYFRIPLNISFQNTGCQKLIEVNDERQLRNFYEKHVVTEVAADTLGKEWKGYCGSNQWWERQTRFPHEAVCLDPWRCPPAPE